MRLAVLLALASVHLAYGAAGVQRVVGRIPCSGKLEVTAGMSVGRTGRLRIEAGEGASIPFAVTLRSNCSYRIEAGLSHPQPGDGTRVTVVPDEVAAPGGTGHLASGALAARFVPAELVPGGTTVIGEGPRISSAGNDSTPDNAIRVRMRLEVPAGLAGSEVTLTMRLE